MSQIELPDKHSLRLRAEKAERERDEARAQLDRHVAWASDQHLVARQSFVVEIDAILSEILVTCDVTMERGAENEARLRALRRYVLDKFNYGQHGRDG